MEQYKDSAIELEKIHSALHAQRARILEDMERKGIVPTIDTYKLEETINL